MIQQQQKIAIIGSFQRFYPQVLEAINVFARAGVDVTSPLGSAIVREGQFVRFQSDPEGWSAAQIQSAALAKIFEADIAFVVAPGGYVGRSTCYEIGRLTQARKPIVFSEAPNDLPIAAPDTHVMPAAALARLILGGDRIAWVHGDVGDEFDALERRLTA